MQSRLQARVWIVIERAVDVPGDWTAHCLDFDVVSQGRSLQHAYEMVREAVTMVVVEDMRAGRDPRSRRAPQQHWERLSKMLDSAEKRAAASSIATEDQSKVGACVVEVRFSVTRPGPQVEATYVLPDQRAA